MIKKNLCFLHKCFGCPVAVALGMIAISVIALGGALGSEVFLGLEPCKLCIYQRWPFVIAIALGVLMLLFRKNSSGVAGLSALCGLVFLVNSAIATYHTGVEQKWWVSAVEGCGVPAGFIDGDNPQSWIDNIMSAPSARCDEIPWQDPLIGLSMANYNMILCAVLGLACLYSAYRLKCAA